MNFSAKKDLWKSLFDFDIWFVYSRVHFVTKYWASVTGHSLCEALGVNREHDRHEPFPERFLGLLGEVFH